MDRSGYDPEAHSHDEDGGNTSDDQDEKDVLKKTKKGTTGNSFEVGTNHFTH